MEDELSFTNSIRFNACPISKKFQVTNIDIDYKLKKFMHLIGFSLQRKTCEIPSSMRCINLNPEICTWANEHGLFCNGVFKTTLWKVLGFYCCCCSRDDRIQPIALQNGQHWQCSKGRAHFVHTMTKPSQACNLCMHVKRLYLTSILRANISESKGESKRMIKHRIECDRNINRNENSFWMFCCCCCFLCEEIAFHLF